MKISRDVRCISAEGCVVDHLGPYVVIGTVPLSLGVLLWFSSSGEGHGGRGGFGAEGSVAEQGVEHVGASSGQGDDGLAVACALGSFAVVVEASWVSFRVSARRIGVCPRSSVQSCVTVPCAWSTTAKPAKVGPAQHRSAPSRHRSTLAPRRCGSGATTTAPPSRAARESPWRRRTGGFGGNSPRRDARTRF